MKDKIDNNLKDNAKKDSNNHLKSIAEEKSFQILKLAIESLKEKYKISPHEILGLIEEKQISKEILLPISIFEARGLSALETICRYLKDEMGISYSKIALLLNRNSRTIWTTYNNALSKAKGKLAAKEPKFYVPVSIFRNRNLSVLENLVSYLKDNFNLRYSEISVLLNRDERNIWTAYNRAKKKNG